jgi:hypothetical protein
MTLATHRTLTTTTTPVTVIIHLLLVIMDMTPIILSHHHHRNFNLYRSVQRAGRQPVARSATRAAVKRRALASRLLERRSIDYRRLVRPWLKARRVGFLLYPVARKRPQGEGDTTIESATTATIATVDIGIQPTTEGMMIIIAAIATAHTNVVDIAMTGVTAL